MAEVATGLDRASFDRMVLDHLPAMQRLAVRLTGNVHNAEDLMQDALLKAVRSWKTYRGESAFATWMTRIVINAFRDERSAAAQRTVNAARYAATRPTVVAASAPPATDAQDVAERVASCVSTLPPRQREVLVLIAYEQMSGAQAAEALGITEANVRVTLHHARQTLRNQLAPYLSPDHR